MDNDEHGNHDNDTQGSNKTDDDDDEKKDDDDDDDRVAFEGSFQEFRVQGLGSGQLE